MFRYGIKSVTMDDVAREVGISKKTIYQHYEDKDAVVMAMVAAHFEEERDCATKQQAEAKDPIQEVVWASEMMRQQLSEMNPTALFDMKKYYPTAWDLFVEFKKSFLFNLIRQNLIKGIEMGLYRHGLNVEAIARLRLEQVEIGFDPNVFAPLQFNIVETQVAFLDHFIRGIVTERGLALYQKYQDPLPSSPQ
jgi:TetR/AcrR family transcriptional regulator, cholesterol catabolism regulator